MSRRWRRVLALGGVAALVPACAAIVGIDDYVLVDAGLDATPDASAPDGERPDAVALDAAVDGDAAPPLACTPCNGPGPALCGLSCDESLPSAIGLDGARVFWLANGVTVRAAPTAGSSPATTFASLPAAAVTMTATAGYVAWADATSIRAAPVDGGAAFVARANEPGVSSTTGPATGAGVGSLFWTTATSVRRCFLTNCTTTVIDQIPSQESPTALVAGFDGTNPYGVWINRGTPKTVQGAALVGGIVVSPLASDNTITPALAIEPTAKSPVYYATSNGSAGQVWQAGVGVVASLPNPIQALVTRGSSLWVLAGDFANPKLGRLVRYDFPGPTKTDLAQNLDAPQAMVVDATSVYFTARGSGAAKGAVFRIAR